MPIPAAALLMDLLSQLADLAPAEAAALTACWNQPLHLRRGDFLVLPGQVEQRLCLVRAGLLRI